MERSVEMIGSNAFNYINVLDKAADASWKRNEIISNNIANVDTPGYKRKDVQFETYLQSALMGGDSLDKRVADADLDSLYATIYTDNAGLSYRLDGNNVDIDTESSKLAQNQIRYYTLLDSMTQEFSRLKAVLQSR
jgi:flagellar basal-body rod protein FlgB